MNGIAVSETVSQPVVPDPAAEIPELVRLESAPCPMGCAAGDRVVLSSTDRHHRLPGVFRVVQCGCCGLLRTDPRPTQDTMAYYYPDDYEAYLPTAGDLTHDAPGSCGGLARRWARKWIRFLDQATPVMKPGRMLEIGCASGVYLHKMAQKGWTVEGIEFSSFAAEQARSLGYPVFSGPVEEAPEKEGQYDLIAAWMALEHLHAPLPVLASLRRMAAPGAWLAVSVPDAGSLEFRLFRERWIALHLPNHLYHFTGETLTRLLARAGWEAKRVIYQRITNLPGSMALVWEDCVRGSPMTPEARSRMIYTGLGVNLAMYPLARALSAIGQSGRMTVWAQSTEGW